MAESPTTPSRRRRSSGLGSPLTPTSAQSGQSGRRTHSRVSSMQSIRSNNTRRPSSAQSRHAKLSEFGDEPEVLYGGSTLGNGLGSLADELAEEEWDEDSEGEQAYADTAEDKPLQGLQNTPPRTSHSYHSDGNNLSPVTPSHQDPNGRSRFQSRPGDYDGSDYGDSDDFKEVEGISSNLEEKMLAIENLARQGTGALSSIPQTESKVQKVHGLDNLGAQYDLEAHGNRLSTAYAALNINLAYQSRAITSLSHSLSSPFSAPPDPEIVEELIPLLETLFQAIPHPPTTIVPSVHALRADTDDLIDTLYTLSDNLNMMRQTTNVASQKLREARQNTAIFRKELDDVEEGRAWLEKENRHEKLQQREAATICKEVVGGFEEFCEDWRRRLMESGNSRAELVAR